MQKRTLIVLMIATFIASSFTFAADADARVRVRGYTRKDGTYVQPHYRSNPDGNPYNNWSYPGNTNPYTGKTATGDPDTYLRNNYDNSPSIGSYSSPSLSPASSPTIAPAAPRAPLFIPAAPAAPAIPKQYIPPSNPTSVSTQEQSDGSLLVNFIGASDTDGSVTRYNVALSSSDPAYRDLSDFRWFETPIGVSAYAIPAYQRAQKLWILMRAMDNDQIIAGTAVYQAIEPSIIQQRPTMPAIVPVPAQKQYITPKIPVQNVRAASSLDAQIIEQAKPGWLYTLVAEHPDWYEVSWFSNRGGATRHGWMMRRYAKVVSY